jgi:anti-sigma factor RsiW
MPEAEMKQFRRFAHPSQESLMTEAALRAYLLGKLTESEAELVEARLLEDADLFSRMETAEDDLFDAFARGILDQDERARFLERVGSAQPRRRFAEAFVTRTSSRKVVPFVQRRWVELAAAACLVIMAGAAWLEHVPVSEQRPVALRRTSSAPGPAAPITSHFVLALGASRAAGAPAKVAIEGAATNVDFAIRLNPADKYSAYAAQIRSQSDLIIWGDVIQPSTEGGDLVVHATVPADRLPSGSYEIAVRGGASASSLDDLGFVTIEVSRIQ